MSGYSAASFALTMSAMPSRRYLVIALTLCDLAMTCLAIAINLLPVFLTTLSHDLGGATGLTNEQLGRIGAVTFAGVLIGIAGAGPLADRWGAKPFAVGGNGLIALGLVALSIAPGYQMVLLACLVMGIGAGALDMVLSPIVSALRPHRRTVAMNLLHSFYCTGAVATILLGTIAIRMGISWRALALGLVAMPLVVGLSFVALPLPPLVQAGEERTPMRSLMRQPFFRLALIAIFLGGATELGMAYWLPAYAEKSLNFSAWTAGIAFVGFSLAMTVGRLMIALMQNIRPIPLMLICCIGSVVLFLSASFSPWNTVALGSCVLAGLAGSSLWPSTLAVAADRYPHGGATMFGVLGALGNLGGIFMPWLVGVVADHSSLRWGLATAALCPLTMIAVLLWMRRWPQPQAISEVPLAPTV
jgi:fucose permease